MKSNDMMKKLFYMLFLLLAMLLTACSSDSAVMLSLPEYQSKELYTEGVWQDFTEYGIYTFSPFDKDKLEKNLYFEKVTDLDNILSYILYFEGWLTEDSDLFEHYSFEKSWIDENDYIFIDTDEGKNIGNSTHTYGKFDDYNVYFFDIDTYTLYYFHSNI